MNLRTLLPLAAVAAVGYLVLHKTARYLGDRAQVGDTVFVPVGAAAAVPGLPAGASQVAVTVSGSSGADVLTGTVTGFSAAGMGGFVPLPQGAVQVPVSVDRSAVTGILRNGKTVGL